jgi:aspartate carbamoyltransferase catalytic subunit
MNSTRDLISIRDLSKKDVESIIEKSEEMNKQIEAKKIKETMKGKILANMFFEPSTRTIMSFSAAMQKLGGSVIGFEEIEKTSMVKGESFIDTVKIMEKYADVLVIRHPKEGSARYAANASTKPVINAGDGANQHPTQTLLDLFTIKKLKGNIQDLNITLLGDLKYARTMHSLAYALAMMDANITLVSPFGLEMEKNFVNEIKEKFTPRIIQTNDIHAGVRKADILYVCRIQKERFLDAYEAEKLQKEFMISPELLEESKEDMIILHPLPKVSEIDPRVDDSEKAKYFMQAYYGIPVRMALINWVFE